MGRVSHIKETEEAREEIKLIQSVLKLQYTMSLKGRHTAGDNGLTVGLYNNCPTPSSNYSPDIITEIEYC